MLIPIEKRKNLIVKKTYLAEAHWQYVSFIIQRIINHSALKCIPESRNHRSTDNLCITRVTDGENKCKRGGVK